MEARIVQKLSKREGEKFSLYKQESGDVKRGGGL